MNENILPVELEKAYRLLNHGPTVLVSASHAGVNNVMAAAWSCALDFAPPKVTVVLDKIAATRGLVEQSGYFVLQVPNMGQLELTYAAGNMSLADTPDKLERCGVQLFHVDGYEAPLVAGSSAWLVCKVIPEPHNLSPPSSFPRRRESIEPHPIQHHNLALQRQIIAILEGGKDDFFSIIKFEKKMHTSYMYILSSGCYGTHRRYIKSDSTDMAASRRNYRWIHQGIQRQESCMVRAAYGYLRRHHTRKTDQEMAT